MWKLATTTLLRIVPKYNVIRPQVRWFLSESFQLKDNWRSRLNSPILQRINVNDIFYEIDHQFQHFASASALDVDLFVNAVSDDSSFDEIEELVHKLRLSPEAANLLPSTHHALIRLYLEFNKIDDLIRILDDRLNYGIFSDDYCNLLLMDSFIKSGNFKNAARISTFNMLQEDVSNPLINYMSLYACHKYLENPVPWNQEDKSEEEKDEDDDEVVKVRVKYIRNPYFDDHFDLVEPNHLIGKTLTLIGSEIDDHIGRTYKLLGLLLNDKFLEAHDYITKLLSSKASPLLCKEGLTFVNKLLDDKSNNEETKDDKIKQISTGLKESLKSLSDSQLDSDSNLLSLVETRLKDLIVKYEKDEINKQLQNYKDWETNRENLLKQQIANINKEKELAEIARQKEMLKEKEQEIFFFDNEDKYDLIIEEKEHEKEELKEKLRLREEAKKPKRKLRVSVKPPDPPLESYFDENIPMKLVKTKL